MKGTILSATAAILLRPPSIIAAPISISTIPITQFTTDTPANVASVIFEKNADSILRVILLICPMLPIPKDAIIANIAKITASAFPIPLQFLYEPRPSSR